MRYDTVNNGMKVRARAEKMFAAIMQDVTPYDCIGTICLEDFTTRVYDIVGATITINEGNAGRTAFVHFDDGRKVWLWINSNEECPYSYIIFERG